MLVLLPPSETKAVGGAAVPLDLGSLGFPQFTRTRKVLLDRLIRLSGNPARARKLIGVPASLDAELARNTELLVGPTLPAIHRYTGVLYDALDVGSMTAVEFARAGQRLAICSALFGLLRPGDAIPVYRLSASSKLTPASTIPSMWRRPFTAVGVDVEGPVIDLRSGSYAAFGGFPGAITTRVVTAMPSGERRMVSHFNKHTEGLLARALTVTRAQVTDVPSLLRVARRAGLRADRTGLTSIEIVT